MSESSTTGAASATIRSMTKRASSNVAACHLPNTYAGSVARRSIRQLARGPWGREKTAAKLLVKYGDLDGIYAHLDEQTPKLRENLANNEHLARANAEAIPLVLDVPLDVDVEDLSLGGWDLAQAEATFARYEMKGQWKRIETLLTSGALGEPGQGVPHRGHLPTTRPKRHPSPTQSSRSRFGCRLPPAPPPATSVRSEVTG